MEDKILAFWLCNLPGIGNRKTEHLLQYFGSPEGVFGASQSQLEKVEKLSEKDIHLLTESRSMKQICREYEMALKQGIRFVYREEKAFPEKLLQYEDMPYGLFYKGRLPAAGMPSVAIVGARNSSHEARKLAHRFGYELAENGVQVISGMARGVDIAAQTGAMKAAKGRTYAVLGTGGRYMLSGTAYRILYDDAGKWWCDFAVSAAYTGISL